MSIAVGTLGLPQLPDVVLPDDGHDRGRYVIDDSRRHIAIGSNSGRAFSNAFDSGAFG